MKKQDQVVLIGNKGELGRFLKKRLPKHSINIILSKYTKLNSNLDSKILIEKIKKPVSLIISGGRTRYRCRKPQDSKVHEKLAKSLIANLSRKKIHYIIYLSTTAVYGEKLNHENVSEKKITKPNSIYSKSKLKAEKLLFTACKKKKIKLCILRLPIVWDCNTNTDFPTPNRILQQIKAKTKIINFPASLVPVRQYLKKDSFLRAIERCLKHKPAGVFNLTPDKSHSIFDFCRLVNYPHIIKIIHTYNKFPESQTYSNLKLKKVLRLVSL